MKQQLLYQSLEDDIQAISEQIVQEKKMLNEAVDLFRNAETYKVTDNGGSIDEYFYFLYPFKGYTLTNTKYYTLLGKYLAQMIPADTEVIVSIEADGIGIATLVAAQLELPLIISKHFHYHTPCVSFIQEAGYHKRDMYLPKVIAGKKVAIVDCMVSTGGTVKAMVGAIESLPGTTITGIFCVNDKNNYRTKEKTFCGYPYKYLISTTIDEKSGKVDAKLSWDIKKAFWENIDKRFYQITEACSTFSNVSKRGYGVGSIIVDAEDFDILAWGFRRGKMHAEQDAINMLKQNSPDWQDRKLTLYSTMEPCIYRNDKGHAPCAKHIADLRNCKWVIIGSKDTADKRIYGEGINYLLQHGKHIRVIDTDETLRPEETTNIVSLERDITYVTA